jgi:hypothetical protein
VALSLLANPAVRQNRHGECVTSWSQRINFERIISVDERAFDFPAILVDMARIRAPVIHTCAMFVRA